MRRLLALALLVLLLPGGIFAAENGSAAESVAPPATATSEEEETVAPADPAADKDPIARGRAIAEANCGRCHAIGETGASPEPPAPPFRELKTHYPVESLAESLAEGIVTGHPEMPPFALTAPQVNALIGYLKTL